MNEQQQQLQNLTSLLNQNGVVTAIPQKVVAHKTYVKMVKSNYETAEYEINVNASRKESQEARNVSRRRQEQEYEAKKVFGLKLA